MAKTKPYTPTSIIGAELRGAVVIAARYVGHDGGKLVVQVDRPMTDDDGFTYVSAGWPGKGMVVHPDGRPVYATVKKGERFIKRRRKAQEPAR